MMSFINNHDKQLLFVVVMHDLGPKLFKHCLQWITTIQLVYSSAACSDCSCYHVWPQMHRCDSAPVQMLNALHSPGCMLTVNSAEKA